MAFKATFVNATDPYLMQLSMSIWWHLGFTQKQTNESQKKGNKKIYTHFIYKLKNLVQMSCYI